jgi:hypothetical protein
VTENKGWLPGMGSNHELDRILKSRKLLILKSRRSRQKHQKQASGTKSVQKIFEPNHATHVASVVLWELF